MKHTTKILLGLAAAFTVSASMAQSMPPGGLQDHNPGPERLTLHPITRAQALERAAKRFDRADINKDGVLSVEEQRAAFEQRRHRHRHRMALRDGDGRDGQWHD